MKHFCWGVSIQCHASSKPLFMGLLGFCLLVRDSVIKALLMYGDPSGFSRQTIFKGNLPLSALAYSHLSIGDLPSKFYPRLTLLSFLDLIRSGQPRLSKSGYLPLKTEQTLTRKRQLSPLLWCSLCGNEF